MEPRLYLLCVACGGRIDPTCEEYVQRRQGTLVTYRHKGACERKGSRLDLQALDAFLEG